MRKYNQLQLRYEEIKRDSILSILPKRAKLNGTSRGEAFKENELSCYEFNPPLVIREVLGLIEKLLVLEVKSFRFADLTSLSRYE